MISINTVGETASAAAAATLQQLANAVVAVVESDDGLKKEPSVSRPVPLRQPIAAPSVTPSPGKTVPDAAADAVAAPVAAAAALAAPSSVPASTRAPRRTGGSAPATVLAAAPIAAATTGGAVGGGGGKCPGAGDGASGQVSSSAGAPMSAIAAAAPCSRATAAVDWARLHQVLEVTEKSEAYDREMLAGDDSTNTWGQCLALRPLLEFMAKPDLDPPIRFQQATETCLVCLLAAPAGCLKSPRRMSELLESGDFEPLLRYMDTLAGYLGDLGPTLHGGKDAAADSKKVLAAQHVRKAVACWPAELSTMRQSAKALLEALMIHGPEHHQTCGEWRKALRAQQHIQNEQAAECSGMAEEFLHASNEFAVQMRQAIAQKTEWPELARMSETWLMSIQHTAGEFLQNQGECWGNAFEEYEALVAQADVARSGAGEARRHVRWHERSFSEAAARFGEVGGQMLALIAALIPRLRILREHGVALRTAVELRRRVSTLAREHLAVEDEFDAAQTELRRQRRHSEDRNTDDTSVGVQMLLRRCEFRAARAEARARDVCDQWQAAERQLQEIEASLPLTLEADDDDDMGDGLPAPPRRAPPRTSGAGRSSVVTSAGDACADVGRSAEEPQAKGPPVTSAQAAERLAASVADLESLRDALAAQAPAAVSEPGRQLGEELWRRIEPDFMCPITHERMREPVLAADGYTYERLAIERWLRHNNSSPMTGAPLAHRYLTENFALRNLIQSYDAHRQFGAVRHAEVSPSAPSRVMRDANPEDADLQEASQAPRPQPPPLRSVQAAHAPGEASAAPSAATVAVSSALAPPTPQDGCGLPPS